MKSTELARRELLDLSITPCDIGFSTCVSTGGKVKKRDIFNGEKPHRLCLAVSYIEQDEQQRCLPRVYLSRNETIWYKDGEDCYGKLLKKFETIENMLKENARRGQMCFLARNYFFYNEPTLDERVELLKGCRFDETQIEAIRKIADSCEQALKLEKKDE